MHSRSKKKKKKENRYQGTSVREDNPNLYCYSEYRWKPYSLTGITLCLWRGTCGDYYIKAEIRYPLSLVEWRIISYCPDNSTTSSRREFIGARSAPRANRNFKSYAWLNHARPLRNQHTNDFTAATESSEISQMYLSSLTVGAIKSKHRTQS